MFSLPNPIICIIMAAFHILADPPLQVVRRAVLSAWRPHKSEHQLLPRPNLRPINDSCTMLVLVPCITPTGAHCAGRCCRLPGHTARYMGTGACIHPRVRAG